MTPWVCPRCVSVSFRCSVPHDLVPPGYVAAEMFNNAFQDNIPDFMDPMDLQGVINREIERLKNLEA